MDEPRFTMKEVAQATRGNVNTIFSWFQRGHFQLNSGDRRAETGCGHGISLRTALEVAIAVELYKQCQLHPAIGVKVARKFTWSADKDRRPGELFEGSDFTVLAVYPEIEDAKVIRVNNKTPLTDAFIGPMGSRQEAATLIWLNFIDKKMRVALLQRGKGSAEG
ncbi:hypothetical protein [Bradyrhizobium diazoefficiens]|uniref:hypothetical protein n=1 Tax=Bradyrhizobium diazoefficiens TaxID=1355477 RepID=UPI0035168504